ALPSEAAPPLAPAPLVLARPDAPAPIQQPKGRIGREQVPLAVDLHVALGGHAVDLLVVVEETLILIERSGHDDGGPVRLGEVDVHINLGMPPPAGPADENERFFYYNQKINCMPAQG